MTSVYDFHRLREEVEELRQRVKYLDSMLANPAPAYPQINGPLYVSCSQCGSRDVNKVCGSVSCPLAPRITC